MGSKMLFLIQGIRYNRDSNNKVWLYFNWAKKLDMLINRKRLINIITKNGHTFWSSRQFHQRLKHAFVVQSFGAKNYKTVFWVWHFLAPKFHTKNVRVKCRWNWRLLLHCSENSNLALKRSFWKPCQNSKMVDL